MMRRPLAIALTGGVGCGKSEAGRILAGMGLSVCDADDVARSVVKKGSAALAEIVTRFGAMVLRPDGELDRRGLAKRVFASADERRDLERIVHPRVREEMTRWREHCRAEGRDAVGIIPLLFETGGQSGWDVVMCVSASTERALERLVSRGWTRAESEARMAAQWPVEKKESGADLVVRNEGSIADLERALKSAYRTICESRN